MGIKTKQFRSGEGGHGNTHLLRLGVIFLSIVSFFTTANGMRDYIFQDNAFIAYAASAAIQGILLAMSMNLPSYLARFWRRKPIDEEGEKPDPASESEGFYRIWNPIKASAKGIGIFFGRLILSAFVVVLTFVTLLCSSWFSYVYIADVLHEDSWDVDSELLVQQVYRTQLYKGREYANTYRIYLEESLGAEILMLETQAEEFSNNAIGTGIDWDEEEQTYAQGIARIYMMAPINAMRAALVEGASPEARNLAVIAVADADKNVADQMDRIQKDITTQNDNIQTYTNLINSLNRQIANAADDRDTSILEESLQRYENLILNATQRLPELQDEYSQLYNAQQRLPVYESQLGLNSSTSSTSIRSELMKLQAEFFQQDPDEAIMLSHATEIFKSLRDAVSSISSEAGEDSYTYSELLIQMNRLIRILGRGQRGDRINRLSWRMKVLPQMAVLLEKVKRPTAMFLQMERCQTRTMLQAAGPRMELWTMSMKVHSQIMMLLAKMLQRMEKFWEIVRSPRAKTTPLAVIPQMESGTIRTGNQNGEAGWQN